MDDFPNFEDVNLDVDKSILPFWILEINLFTI